MHPITTSHYLVLSVALLAIGVVLWALTWLANRFFFGKKTYLRDPEAGTRSTSLHVAGGTR